MHRSTLCLSIVVALFSCETKKPAETTNDKPMDSVVVQETGTVEGQAGSIHYEDEGSQGLAIVFLHSFGGSTSHWKNQMDHLKSEHRVIAIDLRGHGQSDIPSDSSYMVESMAADVDGVINHLKLDKFILVGHSMGGAVAIAYAGAHPDRVEGLVLAGTPGKMPESAATQIIQSLRSPEYQKVMDDYMKKLLTGAQPSVASQVDGEFKKISKPASISIITAMFTFDPLPIIANYKGPKLIIASEAEAKQPGSLHKQVHNIPEKIINGTSHWTQLDKPEEFNKILDEFITSLGSKV